LLPKTPKPLHLIINSKASMENYNQYQRKPRPLAERGFK